MKIFLPNSYFISVGKKLPKAGILSQKIISLSQLKNLAQLIKRNSNFHIEASALQVKNFFKKEFIIIEAAGGVVVNKNEMLFIFRHGKWDLPKGKIEQKEKKKDAAVREVTEETGLQKLQIQNKISTSFHIYSIDKKWVLKISYWYKMKCLKKQKLMPQTKEGISEVKWIKAKNLNMVLKNSYPLIVDLLSHTEVI